MPSRSSRTPFVIIVIDAGNKTAASAFHTWRLFTKLLARWRRIPIGFIQFDILVTTSAGFLLPGFRFDMQRYVVVSRGDEVQVKIISFIIFERS